MNSEEEGTLKDLLTEADAEFVIGLGEFISAVEKHTSISIKDISLHEVQQILEADDGQ